MRKMMLVGAVVLCAGCTTTALHRAKLAGLTAKQTAESAYLTVRMEYLLGRVDEETMQTARRHYARFRVAQRAYVEALRLWEAGGRPDDLEALKQRITALATQLHALRVKAESGVLSTTRPSG